MPPGPAYEPGVGGGVGFYQPTYPNMAPVPGYPVYYSPYANANYFFYDGMYWLFQGDRWYSSSWYDGPWAASGPNSVPYDLLRVPVRYYRAPPPYFHGWRADQPPHWGERWGHDWEERHEGWSERDRWTPPPATLPKYQGAYSGSRYTRDRDRQDEIRDRDYRHEPRDDYVMPSQQQPARLSNPQHRESPRPGWAQHVQPAPQHPQPTSPDETSRPRAQDDAKKSPLSPNKTDHRDDDRRRGVAN